MIIGLKEITKRYPMRVFFFHKNNLMLNTIVN